MIKIVSKVLLMLALLGIVFSFVACDTGAGEGKKEYTTRSKTVSYVHFDTVTILSSYGDTTEEEFNSYVAVTDEMLEYYHKLFDIYYEYAGVNNIRTINQNAGKAPVEVEEELLDFLAYCKEMYVLTGGKTNIMFGSVLQIWHDTRESAEERGGHLDEALLPTKEQLAAADEHTSIDLLVIDREAGTVYISDAHASLDVGAVAKGYVVTKITEALKERGANAVALNAGGNIATIGLKPDSDWWVTGITNPDKTAENSLACRVEIGEVSLVTSGDYERYFMSGDRRYHHIIDPATLQPADYFASVSIFTQDSGLADALSTALFCMSYEEGLALVRSIGDVEVLWIFGDGTLKYTEGVRILP